MGLYFYDVDAKGGWGSGNLSRVCRFYSFLSNKSIVHFCE